MASRMLKSRGSFASPATVVSGDYLGRYEFAPYTPSGGFVTTAVVGAQASGTITGALAPTRLYLAAASGGVSSDPFGSSNVGLYLTSNNAGTPPLVTIPSLNQGFASAIATVNNGGTLSTSPNLAFSSGMFRVGAQSGTAGGPTVGTFLASVQGASGTPPPILAIIGLDTSTSPHLQLYGPWNGALTYMDQTYVAPGSAEATKYGFSNVFVFDALQQRGAPSLTDAVPTVFWGISALGGTQFPAFGLDGYGASQWANSSAPISSSGYSRVRSNAGHLQYSQNGGAWTNFDAALTTISGIAAGGDLTGTYPNPTIAVNVVSNTKFRQSAGLSVVGNSTNALANVADITATTTGQVLQDLGATIGWAALAYSSLTGTPTLFYQTVAEAGSSLTQRLILNFDGTVVASDSASPARTNIGLPATGPGAGLIGGSGIASITLDAQGRITAATTGSFSGGGYATLEANGTPVTARTIANFSSDFGVVDNGGATRTDISLANAGAGAGTYGGAGLKSLTLDAKGRVTAVTTATYLIRDRRLARNFQQRDDYRRRPRDGRQQHRLPDQRVLPDGSRSRNASDPAWDAQLRRHRRGDGQRLARTDERRAPERRTGRGAAGRRRHLRHRPRRPRPASRR